MKQNHKEEQQENNLQAQICVESPVTDAARPLRAVCALGGTMFANPISIVPIATPAPDTSTPLVLPVEKSFLTLDEIEQRCAKQLTRYVVEGFLPVSDVHGAVGDSGLGKTPWAYQLGLCVATGQPFLGMPVKQGLVLYFDGENGDQDITDVKYGLYKHLKIDKCPKNFKVRDDVTTIAQAAMRLSPSLIIIDTIRALYPEAERSNNEMAQLLNDLRLVARKEHSAILLLHHPKKYNPEFPPPPLEDNLLLDYLNIASGARSFINLITTRIGFDRSKRHPEAAFVMKYHIKTKTPSEAVYIERILDDETGEALGYQRIVGISLLNNNEQEAAFRKLSEQFTFKQAMQAYERANDPTNKFLKKCEAVGIACQTGRGQYRKVNSR